MTKQEQELLLLTKSIIHKRRTLLNPLNKGFTKPFVSSALVVGTLLHAFLLTKRPIH